MIFMVYYNLEEQEFTLKESKDVDDSINLTKLYPLFIHIFHMYFSQYNYELYRELSEEAKKGLEFFGFEVIVRESEYFKYKVIWHTEQPVIYAMSTYFNKYGLHENEVKDTCRNIIKLIENKYYDVALELEVYFENVDYKLVAIQLRSYLKNNNIDCVINLKKIRLREGVIYAVYVVN